MPTFFHGFSHTVFIFSFYFQFLFSVFLFQFFSCRFSYTASPLLLLKPLHELRKSHTMGGLDQYRTEPRDQLLSLFGKLL